MSGATDTVGQAKVRLVGEPSELLFVFAHPTTSYLDHFLTRPLVERGVGVLNVDGRFVGDGSDLRFEDAALDIARAIDAWAPTGSKVVLTGHSGGGSLMALVRVRLRVGDAVALLAPHPSRAHVLSEWIDPSVTDDGKRDPNLDLYRQDPPLAADFVEAYRRAQLDRLHRIAEIAADRLRHGDHEARIPIDHVCADPRFVDPWIDANERDLSRFPFGVPASVNERNGFLVGAVSPVSFFDQWYLPTTTANGPFLAQSFDVPTIHVSFGADSLTFPSWARLWLNALPEAYATNWSIRGAVHNPRDQPDVTAALADRLIQWARSPRLAGS